MYIVDQRVEVLRLDASKIPVFPEEWDSGTVREVTVNVGGRTLVVDVDGSPTTRTLRIPGNSGYHPYLRKAHRA